MLCATRRKGTASLRVRLTLWNAAVVLLLMIVCLLAVREGLRVMLLQTLNQFLVEEWEAAAEDIEGLYRDLPRMYEHLQRRAWGHPRRRLFVQIFDDSKKLLWSSLHTPELPPWPASKKESRTPVDVGDYRILEGGIALTDAAPLILRVGAGESAVEDQLGRITQTVILVGGVILMLIPLGAYYLAGRATKPLADIIKTTEGLHPANLNERLPLPRTRDELEQLSRTINGFLDRIADYLRQNREFTANVAHELRSPLAAMQCSLELALNSDRATEAYKEVLLEMLEECGSLRTLVNQLLLLAEGDAGLLCARREPVRLDHLLAKSLDMFQVVAEAAGVNLHSVRLDPVVTQGDGPRLGQVFNNLIDNAIKFTPPGGTVSLELVFQNQGGQAQLQVADSGCGIAANDVPHIFERFYQGDKSRQRQKARRGTGLGLSICRSIVTAHEGDIKVSSTPGQGTIFTLTLPHCFLARGEGEITVNQR